MSVSIDPQAAPPERGVIIGEVAQGPDTEMSPTPSAAARISRLPAARHSGVT